MLIILIMIAAFSISASCLAEDFQAAKERAPRIKAWHEQRDREMVAQFKRRMAQPPDWSEYHVSKPIALLGILFVSTFSAIWILGHLGLIK